MTARYQHVTDTMRSQVASQVGELIWESPVGGRSQAAIVAPGDPAATVHAPPVPAAGTPRRVTLH